MDSLLADMPASAAARALIQLDAEKLFLHVLIQLAIIIAAARAFGALAQRIGQPSVVGEIIAGLVLGPSLLGWVFPGTFHDIFRPGLESIPGDLSEAVMTKVFTVIAQIGLIFLLFLVGLEFEHSHVRSHGRAALSISIAGIVVPFALGAGLALIIYPYFEDRPASLTGFSLFLGVALSITAIPVLGRILMELNITRTRLGAITITAAAVDDAIGWILLASVAAVVKANFDPLTAVRMLCLTIAFVLFMIFFARPVMVRYFSSALRTNGGRLSPTALAFLFVSLLLASAATSMIGIFAVFGAFLLGAVLSDQEELRQAASAKLHDIVTGFFVPVFFTYSGLRTDITGIGGGTMWLICGAVIVAAVVGKLVGCGLTARMSGFNWKESGIIGAMMNARGLMALVAINVGYELGVVPKSLYAALVLMALVTTMLTTPLLLLLRKGTEIEEPIARSGFLGSGVTAENAETAVKNEKLVN